MANAQKIDSNATGLRYAEELSYKVLPVTPIWYALEPNTYADFGGQPTLLARNPINDSRQRKKGVITDLDASGGFNSDLTQDNLQDILQGFFFADLRRKGEEVVTAVATATDIYTVAETAGFQVGDIVLASGFTNSENNGLKDVSTVTLDTTIAVSQNLVDEGTPPADAKLVVVGHTAGSGDIEVDASSTLPALTSTTLEFDTLGLVEGEWIFVGGDGASEDFTNSVNNGFKRVRSIDTNRLTFDKSDDTMVTEVGGTLTIKLYFGRVLKNEQGSLIKRRTYNLERTLGAPDEALPAQIQAEYLEGAVPGEFNLSIPSADKLTVDLSFLAADNSTIDGALALKTGTRPTLVDADAFNTSSDFSRIKLAQVVAGDEAPTPLFAFAQEISVNISNNLSANKAVGTLGSFDITAGTFQVGGNITAYFADVAAVQAVRDNVDITLDFILVKANAGIAVDLPLIALGDGRPNVEQDQPITLPLSMEAASAAKVDSNLDYTAMMVFFDYLPDAADV